MTKDTFINATYGKQQTDQPSQVWDNFCFSASFFNFFFNKDQPNQVLVSIAPFILFNNLRLGNGRFGIIGDLDYNPMDLTSYCGLINFASLEMTEQIINTAMKCGLHFSKEEIKSIILKRKNRKNTPKVFKNITTITKFHLQIRKFFAQLT